MVRIGRIFDVIGDMETKKKKVEDEEEGDREMKYKRVGGDVEEVMRMDESEVEVEVEMEMEVK